MATETFYLGHGNPVGLIVKSNRTGTMRPESLEGVTRVVVSLIPVWGPLEGDEEEATPPTEPPDPTILDSQVLGEGTGMPFEWREQTERGRLILTFGATGLLTAGTYRAVIVVYGLFMGRVVLDGFVVEPGLPVVVRPGVPVT